MNTKRAERVALYARISQDAGGRALGVKDQLDTARGFAGDRGYEVVGEFSDNDISAFRGKARPDYQRVLDLARRHQIDRVIVFHLTRLTRNRRERAEFIDDFHEHRVNVSEAKGSDYDLSTTSGRAMVDMQGVWATWESEIKSERVTAAAERRARDGRPSGALGYGWEKTGTGASATYAEHPHEAEVVREIVDRLLAGESLRAITDSLNERGEPAPKTPTWGKTSVKKVALRESNVAVRVHHRGQPDETRYEGGWPALVDPAKHARVVALLTRPERRVNETTSRPGARKHLLTWGVGECGICGGRLRVAAKGNQKWGSKADLYICEAQGCTGRNEVRVDELVQEVVIARLSRPDALDWMLGDDEEARRQDERARALRQRLDEAADSFADGAITKAQLERITARTRPDLEDAEAKRSAAVVSLDLEVLRDLAGPMAREKWEAMHVTQRRAVVETLGMRVIIDRVKRRGPGFDPESVRIEWKGQA